MHTYVIRIYLTIYHIRYHYHYPQPWGPRARRRHYTYWIYVAQRSQTSCRYIISRLCRTYV